MIAHRPESSMNASASRMWVMVLLASTGACDSCRNGPGALPAEANDEDRAPPVLDNGGSGCGQAPPQTGDFHLQAVDKAGAKRDYEALVDATYSPTSPLPVVFVYHGAQGTETDAKGFGLQNAPGAANAAIFVFPQGGPYKNYGAGWDDSCGGYDVDFFDKMLSYVNEHYCIDRTKVFAAGFSWGCDFVTALACCRGNRIRAVAAASCSDDFATTSDYQTYLNLPCPAVGTTAVRYTHAATSDTSYPAPYFATTSALYRFFNSCRRTSVATSPTPCVSFQGCARPFIECAYQGLGHSEPGDWAPATWAFFSSFH
jgi:polyhydroxybutyrate depolymerase